MTDRISFSVLGKAAPQGSKTRTRWGMREDNPNTMPWRDSVAYAAREAMNGRPSLEGPVNLNVTIRIARPKHHYRTGKHQGQLRADAPTFVATRPDLDKYCRAIGDALTTARVFKDDGQIATIHARKVYADEIACDITVEPLPEGEA